MSGRDPFEQHRVATPLELLFDLTFVVAFGVSASEFAHLLAENHVGAGLAGFAFATFAVCWAWINFSWFASAYDTDDWVYRLTTMLQMVGVIILALGVPQMCASIAEGKHVENQVMVAGYVVMRIAMVFQWLRAARQDPQRRAACLTYAANITVAQIGWIGIIIAHPSVRVTLLLVVIMTAVELMGPWVAETRKGGTPWHAHHMAERNGLLAIIALGVGVVGTVASLSAVLGAQGWTMDAVLVAVAGTGLTFGMWWVYFVVPTSELLHVHRERPFAYGYLQIVVFGSIVATGAGLHAAAYTSSTVRSWDRSPRCCQSPYPSPSTSSPSTCSTRCWCARGTPSTGCFWPSPRWCRWGRPFSRPAASRWRRACCSSCWRRW
jgi:low temperature requirement protein LtrA